LSPRQQALRREFIEPVLAGQFDLIAFDGLLFTRLFRVFFFFEVVGVVALQEPYQIREIIQLRLRFRIIQQRSV